MGNISPSKRDSSPTVAASTKRDWNPSVWCLLCLIIGVALLFVSPKLVIVAAPLFLACFILSIIAIAKGRVLIGALLMVLVFTISPFFFLGVFSHAVSKNIATTKDEKRTIANLTFEEVSGSRDKSYMYLKGLVRNRGASPVDFVIVQVSWLDKDGAVLDTGEAYVVALDKLQPGDAKSFRIMTPSNPKMTRYTYRIPSE